MSFDEYVNHISQKYRLAVAISVIRTKPNDLSMEDYLIQLQRKINMESDPNETVCSDDFNFDDDTAKENQQNILGIANNHNHIDLRPNDSVNENSQMSQTILENFEDIVRPVNENSTIESTLKLLKANEGPSINIQPSINQPNSSQVTFCDSQIEINNSNNTFCYSVPNAELILKIPDNNIDSQETQLYTLHGFTQDYTHVSQTQQEQFFISEKYIRGQLNEENDTQYIQFDNNNIVTADIEYNNHNETAPKDNVNNKNINEAIEKTQNTERIFELSNDIVPQDMTIEHIENPKEHEEMEIDKTDSEEDTQIVKVPFKVFEELNKIRSYFNKKDRRNTEGYSTDSGYRSDSQTRSSFKTTSQYSQLSFSWVNQSAHCLYSYIVQAPIVSDDITNEIAQVLGQLIDRLHEAENYPPFLEELLDTVNSLIRNIHEGGNLVENVLLTNDENIHRLILLNKSKHILRHTIENITDILEKLHPNLRQENLYELTNIAEMENVCYIFHILEIFLKRYMKLKNVSSQVCSQNSQEDGVVTKRSSLTDLWRKKWNPNYKEITKIQENVTVCVVKRCSDILNKIIVECMDGYSLVAYAALQCFNLIQS